MRHHEEEHTVECSGRIVLVCKKCGENTTLLGLEEDWALEERTDFTCACEQNLTLADRESEEVRSVRRLLRGSIRPAGGDGDYRRSGMHA